MGSLSARGGFCGDTEVGAGETEIEAGFNGDGAGGRGGGGNGLAAGGLGTRGGNEEAGIGDVIAPLCTVRMTGVGPAIVAEPVGLGTFADTTGGLWSAGGGI